MLADNTCVSLKFLTTVGERGGHSGAAPELEMLRRFSQC